MYLAPAFVGTLFFAARIWDAVNDPIMGMIVDNTHTRFGKFRIWLIMGTLVNSIVFVLLFHSFHLSGRALYIYVAVMYILYGRTYTIMDVPYWSWLPNLTNDPKEREKVSVIPRFFASLSGFTVSTAGLYIINYERLIQEFPEILFESCASGGGRFDPGMLYYAPQCWTSDDSDAIERLKIQYGTSLCYPLSSMGSHVSIVPNYQVFRITPLHTRANVAYFGTFGYELDLDKLSEEEIDEVKKQILFMKKYREILQFGDFYRLKSPFEGNEAAWMTVSPDRNTALVGWYRVLNGVNMPYGRIRLQGLKPDALYENVLNGTENYGDELMNYGLITTDVMAGQVPDDARPCTDFDSRIYLLRVKKQNNSEEDQMKK